MTAPTFNQAAQAYEQHVVESNEGVSHSGLLFEAEQDTIKLDVAAKKLQFAIEQFISDIKGNHIGKPNADSEELSRLIIDYIQDDIGHEAADVLRAALEEKK